MFYHRRERLLKHLMLAHKSLMFDSGKEYR